MSSFALPESPYEKASNLYVTLRDGSEPANEVKFVTNFDFGQFVPPEAVSGNRRAARNFRGF